MPRADTYIRQILERFEGAGRCRGYVPMQQGRVLGNSGVTIGTGVDLGQHSRDALEKMGVPASITGVLVPYLGLRKEDAVSRLKASPLVLATDAVAALDRAVIGHFITRMEKRFDKTIHEIASAPCPGFFAERPREVQAVLVSLAYHLGFGGFPRTYALLASGQYTRAIAALRNSAAWNHRYMYRRREEAALIEQAVFFEQSEQAGQAMPAGKE